MLFYLAMLNAMFNDDWLTAWFIFIGLILHLLRPMGITKS